MIVSQYRQYYFIRRKKRMKKILSLALVLCMAIACFAFAPTSAEIYWGNLLTTTEESVSVVYDSAPWGAQCGEGFISTWSYPGGSVFPGYAEGSVSKLWTVQSDVIIDGENRYGDAQALVADLSKSGVQVDNAPGWGVFLDITTNKVEAGKTYTMFYMIKGSDNFGDKLKVASYHEGNYANNMAAGAPQVNVTVTNEWQLVKVTFTAVEGKAACMRIAFAEQEEIDGYLYVDGIAMVEGNGADIDATYYENNYKNPMDIDGDKLYPDEDFDVDGDDLPNQYDTDIDGDGTKNVWDYDIDGDKVANGADDNPFGLVSSFVVIK